MNEVNQKMQRDNIIKLPALPSFGRESARGAKRLTNEKQDVTQGEFRMSLYDGLRQQGIIRMRLTKVKVLFFTALFLWAFQPSGWTDEPTRVAIIPFKMNAERDLSFLREGIVDMLTTRLSWENKVVVIPKEATERVLSNRSGTVNEEAAREIGTALSADYVLFGSLTIFGESVSIDAKMIDVAGSKPPVTVFTQGDSMDSVIPKVDAFAQDINEKVFGRARVVEAPAPRQATAQAPSPDIYAHPEKLMAQGGREESVATETEASNVNPNFIVPEGRPGGESFWKSQNFAEDIRGISIGDIDGDGNQETVFISTNTVFVYRNAGGRFLKVTEVAGSGSDNFLGVDVADVNRNGKTEIFITNLNVTQNTLASFVLEWEGDALVRLAENENWYYRVTELPSQGYVLLGQRRGAVDPFQGDIYELGWTEGRYEPVSTLDVPRNFNVLSFAMGDVLNNGTVMVVAFRDDDRLEILTKAGSREWKSGDRYGGSENYLNLEPTREATDEGTEEDIGKKRLYLPQRIFIKDLDGNGKHEVLVVNNQAPVARLFSRFRHFASSEIDALSWDGLALSVSWQTKKIGGYVSDFAIGDFDNDNQDELVAVVVTARGTSVFSKAKSAIISYDLNVPEA